MPFGCAMPELPEAEVVAIQLRERLVGASVSHVWLGRRDIIREGFSTLSWYQGATISAVERRGKCLVLKFRREAECRYLVAELGMTGLFFFNSPDERYSKHTHFVLSLGGGLESELRYWNPRRFGRIYLLDDAGLERFTARRFGCDPLTVPWPAFRKLVQSRRGRLKQLLMHQQVIAGIGNIYANEILYRARVHPYRQANRLQSRTIRRLFDVMQTVLIRAFQEGGSSIRDYIAPDGTRGHFKNFHLVYDKAGQPCSFGCGKRIRRLHGERTSYYCPSCQRL